MFKWKKKLLILIFFTTLDNYDINCNGDVF